MTLFALALVLAAAVFHATWNLLAKQVGDGGAVFVWLFGLCSLVIRPARNHRRARERAPSGGCAVSFHVWERCFASRVFRLVAARIRGRGPLARLSSGPRHGAVARDSGGHRAVRRKAFATSVYRYSSDHSRRLRADERVGKSEYRPGGGRRLRSFDRRVYRGVHHLGQAGGQRAFDPTPPAELGYDPRHDAAAHPCRDEPQKGGPRPVARPQA